MLSSELINCKKILSQSLLPEKKNYASYKNNKINNTFNLEEMNIYKEDCYFNNNNNTIYKNNINKKVINVNSNSYSNKDNKFSNCIPIINLANTQCTNNASFFVSKINISNDTRNQINNFYNNPNSYFKDISGVILNKIKKGPKYKKNSMEVISSSIVGSIEEYKKIKDCKIDNKNISIKNKVNMLKKENSIKSINSFNNNNSRYIESKSLKTNSTIAKNNLFENITNNKNTKEQVKFYKYLDNNTILNMYKDIRDRIYINKNTNNMNTYINNNKIKDEIYNHSSSEEEKTNKFNITSYSKNQKLEGIYEKVPLFYNTCKVNNNISKKNIIMLNNTLKNNTTLALNNNKDFMYKTSSNIFDKAKLEREINNYDKFKKLRKNLKKINNKFINKIYGNRIENLNSSNIFKATIPIETKSVINNQTLALKNFELNKEKQSKMYKNICRISNKPKLNSILNKSDDYLWKTTIKKLKENNKSFSELLGNNYWMATLRRPSNFKGERCSFYNSGKNNWFRVREKVPHDSEILVHKNNFDDTDNIDYDNYNTKTANKRNQNFNNLKIDNNKIVDNYNNIIYSPKENENNIFKYNNNNNIRIKSNKINILNKNISNNKNTTFIELKKSNLSNFISLDKNYNKIFNCISNIHCIRLNGIKLLDFEINQFNKLNGKKKKVYKNNYNIAKNASLLPDEVNVQDYLVDYN